MKLANEKPIYAIKNGVTVSIKDVTSGLECGCFCPACLSPLIAKKGEVRAHHFAHHKNKDCGYDYLGSLYLLAEKILKNIKSIYIPDINIYDNGRFVRNLKKGCQLAVDKVERKDGKKTELIVYYNRIPLQIKLLKSTRTISSLKKKMAEIKQAMIAIDISEIDEWESEVQLKNLLTNSTDKKIWIYSPKAAKEEEKLALAKKQDLIIKENEHKVSDAKERLYCASFIEQQKILQNSEDANKLFPKSPDKLKNRLIGERAREIMNWRREHGKSPEERDPRVTLKDATEEYNTGLTTWAKEARARVEDQLGKVNLK